MRQHDVASAGQPVGPLVSPWPVLLAGLALTGVGWAWGLTSDATAPGLRVLVLAAGLTAIGAALALYLPHARGDLEGRLSQAGLWLLGAAAAYLARLGLGSHYDSLGVLLQVLTLVAVLLGILTALPAGWRMLAGTLLVLLYLGALLTAVAVVPPPNGPPPYLANHLWNRVTRPFLQFTVLNNGYHFYAPEPGPAALLWFRVEFEDGASCWVRIPDHKTCRNHLERRRWGALATMTGQTVTVSPDRLDTLHKRRVEAGERHDPPIPMGEIPVNLQYHEPSLHSMVLLASFARRVARTTPHPAGLDKPVAGVKIYRVDYFNPPVQHFHAGRDPLDPTLYAAYYQGEYDREGKLKPTSLTIRRGNDGRITEEVRDPFLYWQIPIVRLPSTSDNRPEVGPRQREGDPGLWSSEGKVINYVRIHAGDRDEESVP
jgi:hypothetical protein